MGNLQRVALAVVGLAVVTTLVLPKRQTPQVLTAGAELIARTLGTAMGTARPA